MTTEQTIQAELDAYNVKMAIDNGTNTVKASYVSKEADGDRAISLNAIKDKYNGIGCDECEVTKSQEPKTGHWIEERTYMECPNCHDIWHYEENQTERFKFCPTCGVRIE